MSTWSKQDLENIAKLAKLQIKAEDMDDRLREFADILSHIEVLEQAPSVPPENQTQESLAMADDTPRACLPIEDVLKNASNADAPFFFIPTFIEGGKS